MSYAAVSDITAEFKNIDFTASNAAVSSADVAEFIRQEENTLESKIAGIYQVPVTGSHAMSIMKLMSTLMVKARVQDILYIKTGKENADQGNTAVELRERIDKIVLDLTEKRMILTDATLVNSSGAVSSYVNSNSIEPTFEKGSNQW